MFKEKLTFDGNLY